jgi:2-methylisocitrate lyase-like PEP mutase family enzyme
MSTQFQKFLSLHHGNELFVLPNAWDAQSAIKFQEQNFPAVGTSSAAVANSLGYDDGEKMPLSDYLFVINRIVSSITIPLTVDLEMGYGKTNEDIYANISKLIELGVVGINIEDSTIIKSERSLQDAAAFAKKIYYIKTKLGSTMKHIFINTRCDTHILNVENKQKETVVRLKMYESTGADGIFLPCICNEDDIAEAVDSTKLPLNVMCIPGLPDLGALNKLGVKRASMGPFLFKKLYNDAGKLAQNILQDKSFAPILS